MSVSKEPVDYGDVVRSLRTAGPEAVRTPLRDTKRDTVAELVMNLRKNGVDPNNMVIVVSPTFKRKMWERTTYNVSWSVGGVEITTHHSMPEDTVIAYEESALSMGGMVLNPSGVGITEENLNE